MAKQNIKNVTVFRRHSSSVGRAAELSERLLAPTMGHFVDALSEFDVQSRRQGMELSVAD